MKKNTALLMLAAQALAGSAISESMAMGEGTRRRKASSSMPARAHIPVPEKEMPGAWKGDGVLPQGETRQMRRARERREQKNSRR